MHPHAAHVDDGDCAPHRLTPCRVRELRIRGIPELVDTLFAVLERVAVSSAGTACELGVRETPWSTSSGVPCTRSKIGAAAGATAPCVAATGETISRCRHCARHSPGRPGIPRGLTPPRRLSNRSWNLPMWQNATDESASPSIAAGSPVARDQEVWLARPTYSPKWYSTSSPLSAICVPSATARVRNPGFVSESTNPL